MMARSATEEKIEAKNQILESDATFSLYRTRDGEFSGQMKESTPTCEKA
jgi:hypothetical protein